jgi:hypothetical protein
MRRELLFCDAFWASSGESCMGVGTGAETAKGTGAHPVQRAA